jgi:excisionase family DNA binding protein
VVRGEGHDEPIGSLVLLFNRDLARQLVIATRWLRATLKETGRLEAPGLADFERTLAGVLIGTQEYAAVLEPPDTGDVEAYRRDVVTVAEFARRKGLSTDTVRRLITRGLIRAEQPGGPGTAIRIPLRQEEFDL